MSFERFETTFYTAIAVLAIIVGWVDGGPWGWFIALVILFAVPALFAYGCHKAAGQAEKKGARDALMRVKQRALADLAIDDPVPLEVRRQLQQADAVTHLD